MFGRGVWGIVKIAIVLGEFVVRVRMRVHWTELALERERQLDMNLNEDGCGIWDLGC